MFQVQKRRKSCCPHGHILQQQPTTVKLESFLQRFPSNFKIHVPSSLTCSRCNTNIYADQQPTVATCEPCNFHLCRSCVAGSSPTCTMRYDEAEDDQYTSRRRKGRSYEEVDSDMSCDYDDPNVTSLTNRYNNMRPNYTLFPRVSYQRYPEPSNFGWKYTGCCPKTGKIEFYEREGGNGVVLMDFDYMTGTVKTVLNHRMDGQIPLFAKGKSLLPDIYQKVLLNPQFSDSRYRRRITG